MPEPFSVLLDQNVPREVGSWLRTVRPSWNVRLLRTSDWRERPEVFEWAQARQAVIITFNEDFADRRSFPVGAHHGIVRLRVWPTTTEETQAALERLLGEMPGEELKGALVVIDRARIRIRPGRPGE